MSVTRVRERGRGVYYEKNKSLEISTCKLVYWVRNDPTNITSTGIEDLKFIRSYNTCQVLPSLNKVFTLLHFTK